MATDFAVFLRRFLTAHLAGLRGCSPNTVASYRDTFKLLIIFFRDDRAIPPDKLTLDRIDTAAVTGFLNWLQASRHNSTSTRNQRLAAVASFYRYDTAARVQELADLAARDIRLQPPALAVLTGKGRKTRHVPLTENTAALLDTYLSEHGLNKTGHHDHPLFFNQHRSKLSRGGIAWITRKYQTMTADPTLANADITPHTLRHSKAMHLYEAGIPLPYIRDILGHVDLSTTEIYARASTEAKRRALEAAYTDIVTNDLPEWNQDPGLLNWLANL